MLDILRSAPLWLAIGLAGAWIHARMLQRALERTRGASGSQAKRLITKGLALRLLLFAPVLIVAARAGLVPTCCWLLGHWVGRTVISWRTLQRPPNGGGPMRTDSSRPLSTIEWTVYEPNSSRGQYRGH